MTLYSVMLRNFLAALAVCFCFGSIAVAQTVTGTLQGTVIDANGAVVSNAEVVIRNVETGQERTLTTNNDGFYVASFLPLGRYNITVTRQGFANAVNENVEVGLNQTRVVDFSLSPAGVTANVVTTSETTTINTTNAEIKGTLTSQEIQDKPVFNQSNFLTLAETFTGFQENPTSGQNNPTASSGSSINFNGTGTRGATFQINGVNNDDSSENQNRQGAALSTIKEFQVITNNFTAEFGRGYGAVVLVQTKSGTNNIHGDVYWFHNDSALNAKSFLAHGKKPVTRRNQFGFTSGFPIFRNKLFGFVNLDHKEETGANIYTRDVFLADERNPANWFKVPGSAVNDTPANRAFIQSIIDRIPASLVPNDPRSPRTFVGQQPFDFPARDYSGRLDWNPFQSDNLSARWQYTRQRFDADDIILGERADQNNKQQNFGLTWTHLFSNTTVGEFRYGLGLRTTLVNITAGNDTPIVRFENPVSIGATIIGNAGQFPIQRYQTDNQFVYNITTLFGDKHFLKAGTDIRRQKLDDLADSNSRGFWQFNRTCNGTTNLYASGFQALINGCVAQFQKGYGPFFLENRINESNFYVEDNWKIRSNLTLNLGLRYEYVSAPDEIAGRLDYGIDADDNNWEPRFGFAWSPQFESGIFRTLFGEQGDSSIRGGFGVYHGRIFQSVFSQSGATVRFNPPNAFFYNRSGAPTGDFAPTRLTDPTNGFVFTPGAPLTSRATLSIIDPGLEMPYTQQWNLSIERQMPFTSSLRVSYTGNRGIGLLKYSLDNLPLHSTSGVLVPNHPFNSPTALYGTALPVGDPRRTDVRGQVIRPAANFICAGTGLQGVATTAQCPVAVPIGAFEYSYRVTRGNERRPNPLYTTNLATSNAAWSYYNGLQVEWTKRLSHNLNFQAAYTWSKSLDTTSEATFVGTGDSNQNGNDARTARGFSRFHTPHRFTFFGTYRLPFFKDEKGVLGQAFGGWQLSSVVKLIHGTPFSVITTAVDLNFDGFGEPRPALLDPSILGNSVSNPASALQALPRAAFRTLLPGDPISSVVGRNTFYLDGVQNVDFGIMKVFRMPWREDHNLTVRADLFNAFNHVQFGFPSNNITSANFGAITGGATLYLPRNVSVSLRYTY